MCCIHPQVSQRCVERGIVAIERVSARHIHRLAELTAAEVLGCWDEEVGASAPLVRVLCWCQCSDGASALLVQVLRATHEHSLYTM